VSSNDPGHRPDGIVVSVVCRVNTHAVHEDLVRLVTITLQSNAMPSTSSVAGRGAVIDPPAILVATGKRRCDSDR
jgi:hypothetical protein